MVIGDEIDKNGDGMISFKEFEKYVKKAVKNWALTYFSLIIYSSYSHLILKNF